MKIVFAGQSNAKRIESNSTALGVLKTSFSSSCEIYFSAFGGSALLKQNASVSAPGNYWIEPSRQGRLKNSDLMDATVDLLREVKPDVVIWIQGEQDATRALSNADRVAHKNALKFVFDQFLEFAGFVAVASIGRRLQEKDAGFHLVRMATVDAARETRNVEVMAHNYALALTDVVHYAPEAQVELCRRLANGVNARLQEAEIVKGPEPIDARRYSRAVDVTFKGRINESIGSRVSELFSIRDLDGALLQTPKSAEVLSSIKVRLIFETQPEKAFLCFGVGQLPGISEDESLRMYGINGELVQPAMVEIGD